jgi:hypothetical protein
MILLQRYILNHRQVQQNLQNFLQVASSSNLLRNANLVVHDGGLKYIHLTEAQRIYFT